MKYSKIIILAIGGLFCLLLCVIASLVFGSRSISLSDAISALTNQNVISINQIVARERIPRTVFGIIAGASLGVSGTIMQAITRNPIADPSILGVNTGASLFVVSGIAFLNISTAREYIWLGLLGASLTAVFVYWIGSLGRGGATPIKLALAGSSTSAALSSLVSAILIPRVEVMNNFRFWQVGSIGAATWEGIFSVLPFAAVGMVSAIILTPALNVLALGDDVATGLGVNTGIVRLIGAFSGVLLCGSTTAVAGPIGFIGLMVPHIMRLILGPDLRLILPISAIGGAVMLIASDVIGRIIAAPGELEAGIITAFIGAPALITIAIKTKVKSI